MQDGSASRGYRFGVFELDLEAGQLRRDGLVVRLTPQPFKLLVLLARRAGAVVTREEIRAALWSTDTFVDFDQGVNFAIRQLRDALGDRADSPRWVQTLPKRGYRFLGPVEALGAPKPAESVGTWRRVTDMRLNAALWANIADLKLAEVRRRRWLRVGLIVVAAAILTLVILAAVR
jgi:DNA-binding winged helix-turn-helix (wHTH) protein